jgi:hypothetical protein
MAFDTLRGRSDQAGMLPAWSAAQLLATKWLFSAIAASVSAPSGRKTSPFFSCVHNTILSRSMHAQPSHGAHFAQQAMASGRGSENNSLGKAAKSWSAKLLSTSRKEPSGDTSLLAVLAAGLGSCLHLSSSSRAITDCILVVQKPP